MKAPFYVIIVCSFIFLNQILYINGCTSNGSINTITGCNLCTVEENSCTASCLKDDTVVASWIFKGETSNSKVVRDFSGNDYDISWTNDQFDWTTTSLYGLTPNTNDHTGIGFTSGIPNGFINSLLNGGTGEWSFEFWMTIGDTSGVDPKRLFTWSKSTAIPDSNLMVGFDLTDGFSCRSRYTTDPGGAAIYLQSGIIGTEDTSDSNLIHVVIQLEKSTSPTPVVVYVNGVEEGSIVPSAGNDVNFTPDTVDTSYYIHLLNDPVGVERDFLGTMYSMVIRHTSLSTTEITEHFNAGHEIRAVNDDGYCTVIDSTFVPPNPTTTGTDPPIEEEETESDSTENSTELSDGGTEPSNIPTILILSGIGSCCLVVTVGGTVLVTRLGSASSDTTQGKGKLKTLPEKKTLMSKYGTAGYGGGGVKSGKKKTRKASPRKKKDILGVTPLPKTAEQKQLAAMRKAEMLVEGVVIGGGNSALPDTTYNSANKKKEKEGGGGLGWLGDVIANSKATTTTKNPVPVPTGDNPLYYGGGYGSIDANKKPSNSQRKNSHQKPSSHRKPASGRKRSNTATGAGAQRKNSHSKPTTTGRDRSNSAPGARKRNGSPSKQRGRGGSPVKQRGRGGSPTKQGGRGGSPTKQGGKSQRTPVPEVPPIVDEPTSESKSPDTSELLTRRHLGDMGERDTKKVNTMNLDALAAGLANVNNVTTQNSSDTTNDFTDTSEMASILTLPLDP